MVGFFSMKKLFCRQSGRHIDLQRAREQKYRRSDKQQRRRSERTLVKRFMCRTRYFGSRVISYFFLPCDNADNEPMGMPNEDFSAMLPSF